MRALLGAVVLVAGCATSLRGFAGVARDRDHTLVHAGVIAGLGMGDVTHAIVVNVGAGGGTNGASAMLGAEVAGLGRRLGWRAGALGSVATSGSFQRLHAALLVPIVDRDVDRYGDAPTDETVDHRVMWALGLEGQLGWLSDDDRTPMVGVAATLERLSVDYLIIPGTRR